MSEEDPGGARDAEAAAQAAASDTPQPSAPAVGGDVPGAHSEKALLAEARLNEVLAAYRKLRRETDGHRDRITRNLERRFDQRRERLLLKFIDILDNLDRALEAAEQSYAADPLVDGLILVRTQLLQTLQEEGLERIPVLGLPYDPSLSEAVETSAVDDPEQHHLVTKESLRGYRLNGRIARASVVVIGEYSGSLPIPSPRPSSAPATDAPDAEDGGLDEIVERAKRQEALFPSAFEPDPGEPPDEE